eukprot:Selendium_serpulae@DN1479_c0_g1_i1.p1
MPNDWGYEELYSTFSPFGRIISTRLAIDATNQRNKGFALISYDDINSAVSCVTQMNGCLIKNKKLNVTIKRGEEQYVAHLFPGGAAGMATANAGGIPGPGSSGTEAPARQGGQAAVPHPPLPVSGQVPQHQQQYAQFDGYRGAQNVRYSPY